MGVGKECSVSSCESVGFVLVGEPVCTRHGQEFILTNVQFFEFPDIDAIDIP
jgi:hypothetical protein